MTNKEITKILTKLLKQEMERKKDAGKFKK